MFNRINTDFLKFKYLPAAKVLLLQCAADVTSLSKQLDSGRRSSAKWIRFYLNFNTEFGVFTDGLCTEQRCFMCLSKAIWQAFTPEESFSEDHLH